MFNHHPPDIDVWTFRPSDFRFRPLLCELCVLRALCVKSFFSFELSTVNCQLSTSSSRHRKLAFPRPIR